MAFQQDVGYAEEISKAYGKYHSTFRSQNGQVLALLFEQGGRLVAHISFPNTEKSEDVTDPYVVELRRYAAEHGYADKLRMIYADN